MTSSCLLCISLMMCLKVGDEEEKAVGPYEGLESVAREKELKEEEALKR